jgi:hypothetical protein
MTVRSLTTRLAKLEEQLADHLPTEPVPDDRPPMPLFLRVALRDAHRRLLARGEWPEEEAEGPQLVRLMREVAIEVSDRILDFTDIAHPGWWINDGLGCIDENTLPEDADAVVVELYEQQRQQQEQPPHLAPLPTTDEPVPQPEYGLKELPLPIDEPTPTAVAVPPAPEPAPAPPRHVVTFPPAPPTRGVEGVPERCWKPFRWSTFC